LHLTGFGVQDLGFEAFGEGFGQGRKFSRPATRIAPGGFWDLGFIFLGVGVGVREESCPVLLSALHLTGFGVLGLGFGFWVLGFGFWVLGFGFWVLGLGSGATVQSLPKPETLNLKT